MRWWACVGLLSLGCGSVSPSGDGGSTDSGTSGTTTTTDSTSSSSVTGETTGPPPDEGEYGEWCGFYETSFGFASFEACGEEDGWSLENVTGFEQCIARPLWFCAKGVLYDDNSPSFEVIEITEGPCTLGSCDGTIPATHCMECPAEELPNCSAFADLCFPDECGVVEQDCTAGEKCMTFPSDTPTLCGGFGRYCAVVVGDKEEGQPCTRYSNTDDCAPGLGCIPNPLHLEGQGVCRAYCDTQEPGACAGLGFPDANCVAWSPDYTPLCMEPCDPLAQNCPDGLACYSLAEDGFGCLVPPAEDGELGDRCFCGNTTCQPGLTCADGDRLDACPPGADCCRPFCKCDPNTPTGVADAKCTEEGELCVCYSELYPELPAGSGTVGTCLLP